MVFVYQMCCGLRTALFSCTGSLILHHPFHRPFHPAHLLSATPLGGTGIWLSVPIGWVLADAIGIWYYLKTKTA